MVAPLALHATIDGELHILREVEPFHSIQLTHQPQALQLLSKYNLCYVWNPLYVGMDHINMSYGQSHKFTYGDMVHIAATENRLDILLWLLGMDEVGQLTSQSHHLANIAVHALLGGHLSLARLLHESACSPSATLMLGRHELQAAIVSCNIDCFEYVWDYMDSHDLEPTRSSEYVIHTAAYVGDMAMWEHCISHVDVTPGAFMVAARYGNVGILQWLHDNGYIPPIDSLQFQTAIEYGCSDTADWLERMGYVT
jgi:hypothetical protein